VDCIGNVFDRIIIGAVRDMFEFLFMNFAIFNLADVFIVSGIMGWTIFEVFIVKNHAIAQTVKFRKVFNLTNKEW